MVSSGQEESSSSTEATPAPELSKAQCELVAGSSDVIKVLFWAELCPQNSYGGALTPAPQNVAVVGNGASAGVMWLKRGCWRGPKSHLTVVLTRGDQDPDILRGTTM